MKQSSCKDHKQNPQNRDFWQNGNDGNFRLKIARLL